MLDGRQITVVAHIRAGRYQQAHATLCRTQPGEPWENAVTACLYLHAPAGDPANAQRAALTAYYALQPPESGPALFRTRLGLTVIDALDAGHPDGEQIAVDLIRNASSDGYAARDVLAHPGCLCIASDRQVSRLSDLVSRCGLGLGTVSAVHLANLNCDLDTAESLIKLSIPWKREDPVTRPVPPAGVSDRS